MIEIILIGSGNLGSYFLDKLHSNEKLILKGLYTRFTNWLGNLLRTVTNYIKGGIENLMYFLGLEPEVRFNNTVRW